MRTSAILGKNSAGRERCYSADPNNGHLSVPYSDWLLIIVIKMFQVFVIHILPVSESFVKQENIPPYKLQPFLESHIASLRH